MTGTAQVTCVFNSLIRHQIINFCCVLDSEERVQIVHVSGHSIDFSGTQLGEKLLWKKKHIMLVPKLISI